MKKIITVLFAVLAMSSMFAYMPSKKNVEIKGKKHTYYYNYMGMIGCDIKTSTFTYNTKSGKITFFSRGDIGSMWSSVERLRDYYILCWKLAERYPEHNNSLLNYINEYKEKEEKGLTNEYQKERYETTINLAKSQSRIAGENFPDDCTSASYQRREAKDAMEKVINRYPFFTEENWFTLSWEEWNKMAKDFLENN